MTSEQLARATWHQNGPNTLILKCCVKDGSAVLATIQRHHFRLFVWKIQNGTEHSALTGYAAARRARKALRESLLKEAPRAT